MTRLKNLTMVKLVNTSDSLLEGTIGIILGIGSASLYGVGTSYIVKISDNEFSKEYPYSCLGISEVCLEVVNSGDVS